MAHNTPKSQGGVGKKRNMVCFRKQLLGITDNLFTNVQTITLWAMAKRFGLSVELFYLIILGFANSKKGWYYTDKGFYGECVRQGVLEKQDSEKEEKRQEKSFITKLKRFRKKLQKENLINWVEVGRIPTKQGSLPELIYTVYEVPCDLGEIADNSIQEENNTDINF